jgi:choline dehydrogenase-like flavoprotein
MPSGYDLCVVGTGPSAYFLVRKYLSKNPSARVIVLEAGFNTIDLTTPLSDRDSAATKFKLSPTVNIGLGGTSQLWHNVLAPLDSEDFRAHSWIPHSGWQISRDTLDPYYAEVSEFFGFPKDIFDDPSAYCDFETERKKILFDDDVFDYKVFVHPSRYLRTNVAFNELLKTYKGLKLKQGVVALRFDNVGEKNRLVIYDRTSQSKSTVDAKNYVLCCGALNNPEILLNSDYIRKKIPFIGHYLMDHPMGNFYQYKYDNPVSAKIYSAVKFQKSTSIKIALKLKFKIQKEKQLANSAFYLRPSFSEGFNDHTEELKNQLLTVRSKLKRLQLPVKEAIGLLKDLNMVRQIIQYKTGLLSKHSLTDCMFVTEQIPSSSSRVELIDEKNEYGNYKTKISWDVSNKDIEEVVKLKEFIDLSLMNLNSATATYDSEQYDWRDRLTSAAHHLGTVRMSKDTSNGCVDLNLKLHGFSDIYVCDGSVFPTSGNANPTMTCMALAARLGEALEYA